MSRTRSFFFMFALVFAGEAVFGLPFIIARVFRPTLLDVFGISNLQLGSAFSLYGIVAMLCYFPGGPLADRFSARRLLALALLVTAAGGVIYAQIPSLVTLTLLFGFWGVSTILLFWSALLRATRQWGGSAHQGRAFGVLDGGRGLLAAVLASLTVAVFAFLLPGDPSDASLAERTAALSAVILVFTGITVLAALLVWFWVPEERDIERSRHAANPRLPERFSWHLVVRVLRMPGLWLQAVIVICAYVGYKGTDDFSLYAAEGFGMNDVEAASVGTLSFYIRPIAALCAGLLGDLVGSSRVISWSFLLLAVLSGAIGLGALGVAGQGAATPALFLAAIASTSVAIYALRGVYFALFEEAAVPRAYTGTAIGLVSAVGYVPDIFMGPLMGFLTDRSPGAQGHEDLFLVLSGFAVIGFAATLAFRALTRARSGAVGSAALRS